MPLTVVSNVNPIKITGTTATDTAILVNASGDPRLVHIKFVRWYSPDTAGDKCHITNGMGQTIIKMEAEADDDTQMWPIYCTYDGIRCDDMDSGELYIHIV